MRRLQSPSPLSFSHCTRKQNAVLASENEELNKQLKNMSGRGPAWASSAQRAGMLLAEAKVMRGKLDDARKRLDDLCRQTEKASENLEVRKASERRIASDDNMAQRRLQNMQDQLHMVPSELRRH
jgi:polyhydroxyalkanoate synthesis regulator phasin